MGGVPYNKTSIVSASFSGKEIEFKTKAEAVKYIQTEIDRINDVANITKDPVLKSEINDQATILKASLESNTNLK